MYEFYELQNCVSENGTKLIYTSVFSNEDRWNGTSHTHDFWEIFFCLGGTCEFFVRDESFVVQKGDFVIVNPGVEHWENNIGSKWVVAAFSGAQIGFEYTSAGYTKGSFLQKTEYISQLCSSMIDEAKEKLPGYQKVCIHTLDLLLIQIQRFKSVDTYDYSTVDELRQTEAKRYSITWIKQYIDNNYMYH